MNRSFQSRLGRFQDNIRRKLIDNQISLTGQASDTIRIRLKKSKQGDIQSRIVESADVVPVIFPPLVDVPFRRMTGDESNQQAEGENDPLKIRLETAPNVTELFPIEVMCTQVDKINLGDLLFRVLLEPEWQYPLVMALEVTEPLGTFGTHSIIYAKYQCVYHNEQLPQEIIDYVAAIARRRLHLGW